MYPFAQTHLSFVQAEDPAERAIRDLTKSVHGLERKFDFLAAELTKKAAK
jgi:hypothetical protein